MFHLDINEVFDDAARWFLHYALVTVAEQTNNVLVFQVVENSNFWLYLSNRLRWPVQKLFFKDFECNCATCLTVFAEVDFGGFAFAEGTEYIVAIVEDWGDFCWLGLHTETD